MIVLAGVGLVRTIVRIRTVLIKKGERRLTRGRRGVCQLSPNWSSCRMLRSLSDVWIDDGLMSG